RLARGKNGRMMRPARLSCARSAALAESNCHGSSGCASAIATSGFFVENARCKSRQPSNGHTDPARPVGSLVGNLVGGLLYQEEIKQRASSGTAARVRRLPVGA